MAGWIAVATSLAASVAGLLAWLQSRQNHKVMNSRLDELVALTRKDAKAEGVAEEKQRVADGGNTL